MSGHCYKHSFGDIEARCGQGDMWSAGRGSLSTIDDTFFRMLVRSGGQHMTGKPCAQRRGRRRRRRNTAGVAPSWRRCMQSKRSCSSTRTKPKAAARRSTEIRVDAGAVEVVAPSGFARGCRVKPSPGSRSGAKHQTASEDAVAKPGRQEDYCEYRDIRPQDHEAPGHQCHETFSVCREDSSTLRARTSSTRRQAGRPPFTGRAACL